MKVVNAEAKLFPHAGQHPYKLIERIGRICYKSEDTIGEGTDKTFINMLKNNRHFAMLEHAHVFLLVSHHIGKALNTCQMLNSDFDNYLNISKLEHYGYRGELEISNFYLISGSFRAFMEMLERRVEAFDRDTQSHIDNMYNAIYSALHINYAELFENEDTSKYYGECKVVTRGYVEDTIAVACMRGRALLKKHMPISVWFKCDRGVSHEIVRHRPASFAQESTRYCNYSKNKFGSEITVIKPLFFDENTTRYEMWEHSCLVAEREYFALLNDGALPQEARDVLPNSLKTEIVVTATENEWQHIINLRYHGKTGKPHPQMVEVMKIAYPQLIEASSGRCDDEN